ncbi:RagB/SusD family nutrient uptake outer membrane protein [uncultured Muriicola sp.]|uniref:RagB/SusD family nutrient uptake outer membrane protein n=1 Tax=uncultured Muriicola sp. TaxID=1583102 RepID=UPI0026030019|nr:RagB/SusD family nutrient uptake outer membrane protein [uncultured Muriicola sp.]
MKRNQIKIYFLTLAGVIGLTSCTNLEIEETDSIITEGFQGLADASSAVDGLYNNILNTQQSQENIFALSEVTTDAALIPTRGTDWGDNGLWRVLHQHAWSSEHNFIGQVWNGFNANQLIASQILDPRSNPSATNIGDASFLRAYSMWIVLDNFGQIPFRDVTLPSSTLPEIITGQVALDFILADIDQAIANLPTTAAGAGETLNRASKAAARYLKAKVLLNKHIYLGGSPDPGDMAQVISLVDQIAADGFALQAGFFSLFRNPADVGGNNETIWSTNAGTQWKIFNGLHYRSTGIQGGGWNGFSTLAEYYDLYEGDPNNNRLDASGNPIDGQEERRGGVPPMGTAYSGVAGTSDNGGLTDGSNVGFGYLIGQQYGLNGEELTDRAGAPLTFKRDFLDGSGASNFINNDETTGIRVMKYGVRYSGGNAGNVVLFRYADAHLMKAEAMMRSGGDPTAMVNELRVLRQADPIGSVSEQDLLDERARELYQEQWRRNDLIRFGQYNRDWLFKESSEVGNTARNLFPIPAAQLLANPNLVQNPGY